MRVRFNMVAMGTGPSVGGGLLVVETSTDLPPGTMLAGIGYRIANNPFAFVSPGSGGVSVGACDVETDWMDINGDMATLLHNPTTDEGTGIPIRLSVAGHSGVGQTAILEVGLVAIIDGQEIEVPTRSVTCRGRCDGDYEQTGYRWREVAGRDYLHMLLAAATPIVVAPRHRIPWPPPLPLHRGR